MVVRHHHPMVATSFNFTRCHNIVFFFFQNFLSVLKSLQSITACWFELICSYQVYLFLSLCLFSVIVMALLGWKVNTVNHQRMLFRDGNVGLFRNWRSKVIRGQHVQMFATPSHVWLSDVPPSQVHLQVCPHGIYVSPLISAYTTALFNPLQFANLRLFFLPMNNGS